MDLRIRRVLSLQLVLWLMATLGAYLLWGPSVAKSVWFGGLIAAANTLLLAWRMRPNIIKPDKPASLKEFILSWLERYIVVGVLFALGLGGLKLMPLGLLNGFVLGQLVWIIAPLTIKET